MCGIAGYVTSRAGIDAYEATRRMMRAMARRGPDSSGLEQWPGAVLGHQRLAILDLSPAGHQPMLSGDGNTGIVFNGCIYNFQELRRQLENGGARFRSNCDTEVLLHGHLQWGIDELVPRLRGMFAFGIWDNAQRRLTLVRDRLGVKPLVYRTGADGIAFASTVGALRAAGFGGEVDSSAVAGFLRRGFVDDAEAIYEGIRKLPPATILEWQEGRISQRQYWSLPEPRPANITFEEAVEETETRLLEAVRLRLVSDVNIAALLSGGVDSALICWALTKLNANIRAFTVAAPGDAADETADARETASALGIPHEVVEISKRNSAPLEELQTAYSEPFACQSALGMLAVSEAIAPRAKVLLAGDGGDDVFLGYPFFRTAAIAQALAIVLPPFVARAWGKRQRTSWKTPVLRRLATLLNCSTRGLAGFIEANDQLRYFRDRDMPGERLLDTTAANGHAASLESARRLLPEVFAYHLRNHFVGEFMVKIDGATMHHGLEARSPLLDQELWEFGATLPFALRLHRGRLKAVLREIARRRIGERIAQRPKQGFTVPVERWLSEHWTGSIERLRGDTELVREGWIKRQALDAAVAEALTANRVPVQLWYLLVLEQWLEAHKTAAVHVGSR